MDDKLIQIKSYILGIFSVLMAYQDFTISLLVAGLGSFFVNESIESDRRKKCILENREYQAPNFLTKIFHIIFGVFISYLVITLLQAKYEFKDVNVIYAISGVVGLLSPHIIALVSDKTYITNLIKSKFKG